MNEKRFKRNLKNITRPSESRRLELEDTQIRAIANFKGQLTTLESALGMLHIGDQLGWRALAIVHSPRTLKKYEEILGISAKEFFPEIGPSSDRSMGYVAARKLKDFWKAVTGEVKIEHKKEIS